MPTDQETQKTLPPTEEVFHEKRKPCPTFTTLYRLRQKVGEDKAFGLKGVIPPTRTEVGDVKRTVDKIRQVLSEFPGLAEEIQSYRDEQRRKEQAAIDARRRNQFHS